MTGGLLGVIAAVAGSAPATAAGLTPLALTGANLVIEGNSHWAEWYGYGMGFALGRRLPQLAAVTNHAFAGDWWQQITDAEGGQADGAWSGTATANILLVGEGHNQLLNINEGSGGTSVDHTLTYARRYIADRRARHPWDRIIMLGTLPAGGVPSATTLGGITWAEANARMDAFDAATDDEAKLRDFGLDQVIYWRDLPGLTGHGDTLIEFTENAVQWQEKEAPYVHPLHNSAIFASQADRIAAALQGVSPIVGKHAGMA